MHLSGQLLDHFEGHYGSILSPFGVQKRFYESAPAPDSQVGVSRSVHVAAKKEKNTAAAGVRSVSQSAFPSCPLPHSLSLCLSIFVAWNWKVEWFLCLTDEGVATIATWGRGRWNLPRIVRCVENACASHLWGPWFSMLGIDMSGLTL